MTQRSRGTSWVLLGSLLALIMTAACGDKPFERPAVPPPIELKELNVGGLTRSYRVYRPISLDPTKPPALVLALGGYGNDIDDMIAATQYDVVAEEERFIVAYAKGIRDTWNGGYCCLGREQTGPDDVAFLTQLIDQVTAQHKVDPGRVYVTGISAGAIMAHWLGCQAADRIAGVGSVAGAMVLADCNPSKPVSVIEIHGTEDSEVPYEGGRTSGGARQPSPSSRAVVQRWAELNQCPMPATEQIAEPLVTTSWTGCAAGTAVKLLTINGAGHTWFDTELGPPDGAVDASREMWSFFEGLPPRA